jgi:putative nucleotidyltransferase with HDIG domain
VVGGFLRDVLLGLDPTDVDIALDGDVEPVAIDLAARVGGTPVELDEGRGTWRIALRPARQRTVETIDLSRLFLGNLDADLRRRDFTMNSLAFPLRGGPAAFIDPLGGLADLRAGWLRPNAAARFIEDPVRILRAARFEASLGLRLTMAGRRAMSRFAHLLPHAAPERQRQELLALFAGDSAVRGIRLLDRSRALDHTFPELVAGRGFEQPQEHTWDVLRHEVEAVRVLDSLFDSFATGPRRLTAPEAERREIFWATPYREQLREHFRGSRLALLKLATLLHDIGKPATRALRDGRVRFFGHSEEGAVLAGNALKRLRFSRREVHEVELLVKNHLRPGQLAAPGEAPTVHALRRFFRDLGPLAPDLLVLQFADAEATLGPRSTAANRARHVRFITAMLQARDELMVGHPAALRLLTGDDIMVTLGLEPGPTIGRILNAVEEAADAGEVRTREEALALARRIVRQ